MLDGISAFCAVAGFYVATLLLLWHGVKAVFDINIFKNKKSHTYFFLFLCFLAWSISTGLRSLVLVWGFFGDQSLGYRYFLNGAVGLGFLILGWPILKEFRKLDWSFQWGKFDNNEKWIIIFIGFILLLYVYRVTLPWVDDDETVLYGYVSKLIAGGRTFPHMLMENVNMGFVRSQMVQCWDAQLYGLVNDTYVVRLNRLVSFIFCGIGLYAFLRLMDVRRFWSLVGVATFLSVPELSYLALSLKVDAVVMMFEWGAFLSLILATVCYWEGRNSQAILRVSFSLSVAAILLSAFAFGNRFSGIVSMFLSSAFSLFFLVKLTRRPVTSFLSIFILFFLFMFISAPGYWENYILYKNPMYPIQAFWPFNHGIYTVSVDYIRSRWNIIGLPPVILQFYLIFALGTGLETLARAIPILNHLPMAADRTHSMGWPYLFIFGIFLWPFFIRGNRVVNFIVGMFIFQLIGWSLGFHYSRLFIGSCCLMILAVMMMADGDVPAGDSTRKRAQEILKVLVMAALVVAFLFQSWWFEKRFYGPFLISPQQRYKADVKFLKGKDFLEENVLTFSEAQMLNRFFLQKDHRPHVYAVTSSARVLQILFDEHIFIQDLEVSSPLIEPGTYLLINPAYLKSKSIDKETLLRHIPIHVLTTPQTGWEVYTSASEGR